MIAMMCSTSVTLVTNPPSRQVLTAFGVTAAEPRAVDGGQGTTWRAGKVVMKPTGNPAEAQWRADVLASVEETAEFRVARPVQTKGGRWLVDGWEAWQVVPGREDRGRADDVVRAGNAFHRAMASLPRPVFLDTRDDPWTHGDRMAWEEIPLAGSDVVMSLLEPLATSRRPVDLPAQPVHGDLLGNVLFAAGRPPAIIDWAVYYRPVEWAAAVAVCDALTWYNASADIIARWAHLAQWRQMLIRALIYRIATDDAASADCGPPPEVIDAYRPVVSLVTAQPHT